MEKVAVQCKTREEWNEVILKLKLTGPYPFTEDHCISTDESGHGSVRIQEEEGYTIISAQEYLNEGGKDVSEFKVGDKVKCIALKAYKAQETGHLRNDNIEIGGIYTIDHIMDKGHIGFKGSSYCHHPDNFISAGSATKTQTTKENNMELNSSIRTVFVEEDKAAFDLVEKMQKVFGGEIAEDFTGAMILRNNKPEYLAEIKRLDDIEAKRLKDEAKKCK